jgi:tetratricopeptide (TPR) repeat protein
MAKSSSLWTIADNSKLRKDFNVFEEFAKLLKECELLKNDYLRSYVSGCVLKDWARVLIDFGHLKVAEAKLRDALNLCNVEINVNGIEDFFKPYGGDPTEKAKGNLNALKSSAYYDLGRVLRDLGKFDEALESYKKSAELDRELKDFDEELKCKAMMKRIEILRDWEFGKEINYNLMDEALKVWHELDLEFKSALCGEYAVSLALDGYKQDDLERLRRVAVFVPESLALTVGVLALVEGWDVLRVLIGDRKEVVSVLRSYDAEISKGLKEEFERRMEIVERYEELIKSEMERGLDEGEAKTELGNEFGGVKLLEFVRDVYKKDRKKAMELVELTTTAHSIHAFARIMLLILTGNLIHAHILSSAEAEYFLNLNPTLGKLFMELSEALKMALDGKDYERKLKTAIVKLFYYHV